MTEVTGIDLVTLAIAIGAFIVGAGGLVLGILAESRHRREERPQLRLRCESALPIGIPSYEDHSYFLALTVTNVGKLPAGVSGIGLVLSDRRTVPAFEPPHGAPGLPAVLQTGESRTMWLEVAGLRGRLREEGVRLDEMFANLSDGGRVTEPVPGDWRRLGTDSDET